MNPVITHDRLRKALEAAGEGWIFTEWDGNIEGYLKTVADQIADFVNRYEERFHERPDPFSLFAEAEWKGKAFFQLDTLRMSTEMKIVVWRVLVVGYDIEGILFEYKRARPPKLKVSLSHPEGPEDAEEHDCQGVWDFTALRHFGPAGYGDKSLLFGGYYPLRR